MLSISYNTVVVYDDDDDSEYDFCCHRMVITRNIHLIIAVILKEAIRFPTRITITITMQGNIFLLYTELLKGYKRLTLRAILDITYSLFLVMGEFVFHAATRTILS